MEQIRNYSSAKCPNLFDPSQEEEPPVKIGTEVFDCTMPSELEFDDEDYPKHVQKPSGGFCIFGDKEEEGKGAKAVLGEIDPNSTAVVGKVASSQYDLLTKSIVTFRFLKNGTIIGRPEYAIGSYIPHFIATKTFPVKFRDDDSELSNGSSKLQLLWKSVVGYVRLQLFVNSTAIYLVERRKEGMLVKTAWSMGDLFQLFSDREEGKTRIIFRVTQNSESKLKVKEFEEVDLNLLAFLLAEAASSFQITSQ